VKVLIVGGGGREHAIAWKLRQSEKLAELYCAPGNAGIRSLAVCVPIEAEDIYGIADYAEAQRMDLVVVGPEAPLAMGLVDVLNGLGSGRSRGAAGNGAGRCIKRTRDQGFWPE